MSDEIGGQVNVRVKRTRRRARRSSFWSQLRNKRTLMHVIMGVAVATLAVLLWTYITSTNGEAGMSCIPGSTVCS